MKGHVFNFVTAESRATGQLEYVYYMQFLKVTVWSNIGPHSPKQVIY